MSSPALAITPRGPLDATVSVPGSKSLTNRALLVAALAAGESWLEGPLESVDTVVMREALESLGAHIDAERDPWHVTGTDGRLRGPDDTLQVENSGTSARFLSAVATLAAGPVRVDGSARMRERPIRDLADALRGLGAEVSIEGEAGCPPLRIAGGGLPGGSTRMDARSSSQYVSAVLLAAPYANADVHLEFIEDRVVSRPYVDLTLQLMGEFGADAQWSEDGRCIDVRAGKTYTGRTFAIEPDASAAVYPYCAAAIAGGTVRVEGIPERSLQSDFRILALLERMGCTVTRRGTRVEVEGPKTTLRALGHVDMNDLPDAALAYAVVALFADGPTVITNVANLRIKETDRLAALETEIRRLGGEAHASDDALRIVPRPLHGAEVETYDDHRIAMSFALAGLVVPGVKIRDPECVAKTWPNYFEVFRVL